MDYSEAYVNLERRFKRKLQIMRYVVVDLEATCWENRPHPKEMEAIEIGAVLLASSTGPVVSEFAEFIQPVVEPKLSDFCTQLTSITQQQVDAADAYWVVFPRFVEWIGSEPYTLCSWGVYDLNQFRRDCSRHKLDLPAGFERHINLKKEFARLMEVKVCGMSTALKIAGIPLEGTHHRGIDDAKNIAKLAQLILPKMED
jgi:inhibitor of KinA sporulation pathway (predicted exonuclease)